MARRTKVFSEIGMGPDSRQTVQHRLRAKSLRPQRGAVEALQLRAWAPANAKRRNVAAPRTAFEFFDSFRILTGVDAAAGEKVRGKLKKS